MKKILLTVLLTISAIWTFEWQTTVNLDNSIFDASLWAVFYLEKPFCHDSLSVMVTTNKLFKPITISCNQSGYGFSLVAGQLY